MAGFALAALPPGVLFLAQTWLVTTGQIGAMLSLAKYTGLLGLIFLAFDGGSGLVPAMLRPRHSDAAIRSAYLVYRGGVAALVVLTLMILFHFAAADVASLWPFLALSLLLRFPLIDADLDRRGFQHWAMLLQTGWMLPLCLIALLDGEISAKMAGQAALAATVIMAVAHLLVLPPGRSLARTNFGPALLEIIAMMGAQGIGQLYGRGVLFVLGASFSGPLPALIIYAKQAFNAAGLLVAYLRRIELRRNHTSMGLSLAGQAAITLVAGIAVALAAPMLAVPHVLVLALIAWQSLEKLSSTAIYDFQLHNSQHVALTGLGGICALGATGLALALSQTSPLFFVGFETLGFGLVLALWLRTNQARRAGRTAFRR